MTGPDRMKIGSTCARKLDREQVARTRIARRVPQFGHGASFDLADALTSEIEVLADFFERAGLAAIETEPQLEDLALALVERSEQAGDLVRQQRGCRYFER